MAPQTVRSSHSPMKRESNLSNSASLSSRWITRTKLRRLALGAAAAGVVGLLGFAAFAWRPAIPEIATPLPSSFSADVVARGATLASVGYCSTCHSVKGGQLFAGGYAMKSPFGTLYSTNITPDRETGIGAWSKEAFRRAMREGVARDGSHLFPAFPYDHFTRLSDEDIHALYAFVMTQQPVHAENHPNEMPFPFGIRALQAGWKLLFFHPERFEPRDDRSPAWNRGAYLAEGLSHCSACHTPRGPLGEELTSRLYQGASVDGWFAPALTAANPAPVPWTSAELHDYLTTGASHYHGTAAGPMASVTQGLGALSAEDKQALVTYVEAIGDGDARAAHTASAVSSALDVDAQDRSRMASAGGRLFVAACASCHYNRAPDVNPDRPDVGLNRA